MNELFVNQGSEVSDSFMSKVLHAYKTMHRAALNSQDFKKTLKAVNVFDKTCPESLENIRAAYIALYNRTPDWKSNTKRNGRPVRQAKPSHAMRQQLAADLASLHELLSTKAESSASLTP